VTADNDMLTAALGRLRRRGIELNISQLTAYLYVCENEGLNLSELASVMAVTNQVASYTVRGLLGPDQPRAIRPAADLIRADVSDNDGRALSLSLTPRGAEVRDDLDEIIRSGLSFPPVAGVEPAS
jgi:DNA-binding MarR family transcriptional regulator